MTDQPAEMPRPKKTTSKGGDEVKVHSSLHYPLNGTVWVELANGESQGLHWNIAPGDNFVARDVWERIKDLPGIVSRLDRQELRTDYVSKLADIELLMAPAPRSYIRRLSARTTRIKDDELFGVNRSGEGESPQARLRKLEAQIRKMSAG